MAREDTSTIAYDAHRALVVVDMQNDFADPAGSLFVRGGDELTQPINIEMAAARASGATIVLTQDWHPPVTAHFVSGGGVWPVHCVRSTWGAELVPELSRDADLVIRKGTGGEDGYSAFTVAEPTSGVQTPTGLDAYLRARQVDSIVVVGLAADVCVKATALDAQRAGFDTTVLWSATAAVELAEGDSERARSELIAEGVAVIDAPGATDEH